MEHIRQIVSPTADADAIRIYTDCLLTFFVRLLNIRIFRSTCLAQSFVRVLHRSVGSPCNITDHRIVLSAENSEGSVFSTYLVSEVSIPDGIDDLGSN